MSHLYFHSELALGDSGWRGESPFSEIGACWAGRSLTWGCNAGGFATPSLWGEGGRTDLDSKARGRKEACVHSCGNTRAEAPLHRQPLEKCRNAGPQL